MTIVSVNLIDQHDQELYRCIVTPLGGAAECTHDVKLELYGKYIFCSLLSCFKLNIYFEVRRQNTKKLKKKKDDIDI